MITRVILKYSPAGSISSKYNFIIYTLFVHKSQIQVHLNQCCKPTKVTNRSDRKKEEYLSSEKGLTGRCEGCNSIKDLAQDGLKYIQHIVRLWEMWRKGWREARGRSVNSDMILISNNFTLNTEHQSCHDIL